MFMLSLLLSHPNGNTIRYLLTILGCLLVLASQAVAQQAPRLIVNEFLADPAGDAPGDANGDGTRSGSEDEFLELANISADTLDLTGWKLGDDEAINFTFPDGYMLPPRALLVVFGGGDVSGVPGYDADPLVSRAFQADSSVGNGFANGGDYIVVQSPDGAEDMYVAYNSKTGQGPPTSAVVENITFEFEVHVAAAANEDVSVTRNPDGDISSADPFVQHTAVSSALFSPGQTITGGSVVPRPRPPLGIVFNEILADPPGGDAGDANMDGTRNAREDEFVELANVGDTAVDIGGWRLGDDEGIGFTFPAGYTVEPRGIIVVFGGGDVSNVPGYDPDPLMTRVFQADSSVGNSLRNGGDVIMLLSDDGSYDTWLAYGSNANAGGPAAGTYPDGTIFEIEQDVAAPAGSDNSVTRFPDGNVNVPDPFVQHLQVSANAYSPGRTIDGRTMVPPPQPPVTVVINEVLADAAGDANGDGMASGLEDEFIELINTSEETAVDLSGWSVGDPGGLTFTFPDGFMLPPLKLVAVFGGGDVSAVPGYNEDPLQSRVFAASGSLGDGLAEAGDHAVLVSSDGSYDAYVAFGSASGGDAPVMMSGGMDVDWEFTLNTAAAADMGNSITREPDGNFLAADPFVQHISVSDDPWSPATTLDGVGGLDEFRNVPHPWGTGYAMHFSWWERDRVEVRDAPQLFPIRMDEGTIELWFRPDSILTNDTHDPDWTYLFGKNIGGNNPGDLGIGWRRGEGRLLFFMQDGTNTTNLEQGDDIRTKFFPRWYHLAVTWNVANDMRMYIDGVKVAETPSEIPLLGGTMAAAIGNGAEDLWNARYEGFRGMIDEVRISLVDRHGGADFFNLPTEPYEPDAMTLALWHLDEGQGETTEDATGNGFTGYLGGNDADGNFDAATMPVWIDASTLVGSDEAEELPRQYSLEQNYPNPFNPTTTFTYTIPIATDVAVEVYNVLGQRLEILVDKAVAAGTYTIEFNADRFASGVYFYVLRTDAARLVRKMVLVK